MKKTCKICQNEFEFCPNCTIKGITYKKQGICSEQCYDISNILQRYGCHLTTAQETIDALEKYNITYMTLQSKIAEYYQSIVKEAEAQKPKYKFELREEVIPKVDVEVVIKDKDTTTSDEE